MLLLHAHWQPPRNPLEKGGMLFWTETTASAEGEARLTRADSAGDKPAGRRRKGRRPQRKDHPFCGSTRETAEILGISGEEGVAALRLPSARSGPLPSPGLPTDVKPDRKALPILRRWSVRGVRLSPLKAFQALLDLPGRPEAGQEYLLGDDVLYWRRAATLALETLAAQKLVPVIAQADSAGKTYHARWLPVLDAPKDAPRLALLEAAMPPVCRSGVTVNGGKNGKARSGESSGQPLETPTARTLLQAFLNTTCDALARSWGKPASPRVSRFEKEPAHAWVEALFNDDPAIKASPSQIQALLSSQRAWMRYLDIAGDAAFRVAFRLEAPTQQVETNAEGEEKPAWQVHFLLQARDDPSLLVSAEDVWNTRGSTLTQLNRRFEQPQEKLLTGLGYAARLFPPMGGSLTSMRPTKVALDSPTAYTFLRHVAPVLEGAGFGVLVPPWWNQPRARLGVQLRMRPAKGASEQAIARGVLSTEKLINFRWELSIGNTALTEAEFRFLASMKSPLVQIRGQWVQLDPEQIEAAIRFWEKRGVEGQMSLLEAVRMELDEQAQENGLPVGGVVTEGWLTDWLERFRQSEKLAELPQPESFHGTLRPYQRFGFSWLHFHRTWGLGACLADDMGLGKTIQTIALLLHEKEQQGSLPAPTLLVCPTSVVTNWERETRRFAPGLTTLVHQGAGRLRGEEFSQAARQVDMVLTSYALARLDADTLQEVQWLGVILDEAQNIKNPSAKQTQAVRKLQGQFRLALTGTPVENRLAELWSIMHFLNPGYLGSHENFRSNFGLPIERYNDKEATQRLKQLVNPFILRRVKTDPRVIQDLPEKVETKVYCNLTEEQATLYEAVVQSAMQQIEAEEGIARRGQVLSMLMQLKQICNHPVQYLHQDSGGATSGEAGDILGRSGKLERLTELLEEILAEGDRALIFTQFAEMGHILARSLPHATGAATQFLHGGTPTKARDSMVKRFQEDEHAPPLFILSLKAGGLGLNLTRANHVFHFDRWWNPAVEDQATDRAFRIGQKRNVQVHKFVTNGTLEEMIDDLIESKKGLAEAVIGSGENWLTELSTDELRELVALRRNE